MLLQVGVDFGDGDADAPVALGHAAPEYGGHQDHQRHHAQHQPGQPRAQLEHDGHNEAQHQHVAEDGHQSGSEQIVEHVHVGGDARHQPAHRVAVEEGQIQCLQVRHELLAQIEHGELAGVLHQVDLREFEDEGAHQHAQIQHAHRRQAIPGAGRQIAVDKRGDARGIGREIAVHGNLGQQRAKHLQHRLQQQEDERQRHVSAVWAHVSQQPAHQPGIVCLAEDLFFHSSQFSVAVVAQRAAGLPAERAAHWLHRRHGSPAHNAACQIRTNSFRTTPLPAGPFDYSSHRG